MENECMENECMENECMENERMQNNGYKSKACAISSVFITGIYLIACTMILLCREQVCYFFGLSVEINLPSVIIFAEAACIVLRAGLVLLFAIVSLCSKPDRKDNMPEFVVLILVIAVNCIMPFFNLWLQNYSTIYISRKFGMAYLASYSTIRQALGTAGTLIGIANILAVLQVGINYGRKMQLRTGQNTDPDA